MRVTFGMLIESVTVLEQVFHIKASCMSLDLYTPNKAKQRHGCVLT